MLYTSYAFIIAGIAIPIVFGFSPWVFAIGLALVASGAYLRNRPSWKSSNSKDSKINLQDCRRQALLAILGMLFIFSGLGVFILGTESYLGYLNEYPVVSSIVAIALATAGGWMFLPYLTCIFSMHR